MSAAESKNFGPASRAQPTDQSSCENDGWKRCVKCKNRDERSCGYGPHPTIFQRPCSNAVGGVQYQRSHGGLESIEDTGYQRNVAKAQVNPAQCDQDEQRGQHKQCASDDTAPCAVHEPADIGGKLLRLRAWEKHAVVQCVQKTLLADPAPALHQLSVHDGNLPGWATKADKAKLEPKTEGLAEAHRRGWHIGFGGNF